MSEAPDGGHAVDTTVSGPTRSALARTAAEILAGEKDGLAMRELFGRLEARLSLSAKQLEPAPTRPEYKNFEVDITFMTTPQRAAGWLVKNEGRWTLTDAGRAALARFEDPTEFHDEALRIYREVMSSRVVSDASDYRDSAEYAARVMERLFPDEEVRQSCAALLAETLKQVADYPPEIWMISLGDRLIRLNIGRWAVVTLRDEQQIDLAIDLSVLEPTVRRDIEELGAEISSEEFKALPGVSWVRVPAAQLEAIWGLVKPNFSHCVTRAAQGTKRTPYLKTHSPGVVAYLNQELGENIVGPAPGGARGGAETLASALAGWDREAVATRLADARAQREALVATFPQESWPEMPLERYALGGAGESFCYWMEYKTQALGSISGGSARKHIIFKRTARPGWFFDSDYTDENEAWVALRAGFLELFDVLGKEEWEAADSIPALRGGAALRTKTAFVYFPDHFLPIYSAAHLSHFAELLKVPALPRDPIAANHHLRQAIAGRPEFSGWDPLEVGFFLYDWAHPRKSRRIVKIAPGEQARYWDDCLANSYICVGWDEVGDLTRFSGKQDFKAAFLERFADPAKANSGPTAQKAEELWTLRELEPGDLVIANRGTSRILALGTVNDQGYVWRDDRPEYKHTVGVDWDDSYARAIEPVARWAMTTVAPVSPALYKQLIGEETTNVPVDEALTEIAEAIERKGQVIVYGPPGTGKTYTARRFSVWWLRQKTGAADAAEVLADSEMMTTLEESFADSGQLQRVTFHPSYAYEDFVEGYKPAESNEGGLRLELRAGIFKGLCEAARNDPGRPYLLLIDEINRGNIPKIFGELITLLEDDKRELPVRLPQSGEWFSVPKNIYVLGTMNTADRSIRLLDTALRRRFAFKELMPDPSLLANSLVGPLALDTFLRDLNTRIARGAGREKQIGHAYLMKGSRAVATPDEFSARFRQDILPLLQEYAYDNFAVLADYLTPALVDVDNLELRAEILGDAEQLVDVLHQAFSDRLPGADDL